MIFKIKRIKGLLTRRSDAIKKILTDLQGLKHEELAYEIVEELLRILIREKAQRGKLGLRGLDNIEYRAGQYGNDPGRDIWIKLIYPEELRGLVIDIEVKSSKRYAKEHRKKYNTSVVIVPDNYKPTKVAKRIYNILFETIRSETKNTKQP